MNKSLYGNYAYFVDGARHVACIDCHPDRPWWEEMIDSGRLVVHDDQSDEPCEYCGSPPKSE
jgi:hypothetical protein